MSNILEPGLVFAKGEALGNDYLVVDAADLSSPFTSELAVVLCDRHRGAGADGVLVVDLRDGVALKILNPDGSEAEKSGNGLRILAAYLHRRGVVRQEPFTVRLLKDTVTMRVEERLPGGALMIRVDIGRASFRGDAVGFRPRAEETLGFTLPLGEGESAEVTTVSLSNPHCVVFVPVLERADFLRRAPQLCTHPAFAEGTNVQFARVAAPGVLEAWIWERGAGETLASGSSACAVAAAAVRQGLAASGDTVVRMPGGEAHVHVNDTYDIVLRGPARMVYEGRFLTGPVG